MYVILTYDVNAKRVSKAKKICRKYLHHVQKSVFEGKLTDAELRRLKQELKKVLDTSTDCARIYCFESMKYAKKEDIGFALDISHII